MPASLADPGGSRSIVAAVSWLEGTLLGTIATSIAVIAVAAVGLMMLSGRVNVRHGATVIIGCFILFGAASIAAGIRAAADSVGVGGTTAQSAFISIDPPLPVSPSPNPQPSGYDPYAGAAVPVRR